MERLAKIGPDAKVPSMHRRPGNVARRDALVLVQFASYAMIDCAWHQCGVVTICF
jgi:hypothetical protein